MLLPKECTMKASSNQGAWVTRGPGSPRMSREETNTEKKKKVAQNDLRQQRWDM